ncbi:MAG: hypothetical protein ACPGD5_04200 [Salibacteraceae bacterium]
MNHKFIDIPKYVEPTVYENTVDKIVEFLKKESSVHSIFRLGNVNHPGISDLDIIVVFKNGSSCKLNPESYFNESDKYLVTHDLAGASEEYFQKILPFTFFDNLECIWGTDPRSSIPEEDKYLEFEKEYHEQIGLEFLIKNFLDVSVQQKYGVIKLRSLLQEIKGVRYDLGFLGISEKPINHFMNDYLKRLDNWFDTPFSPEEFTQYLSDYYSVLRNTIIDLNLDNKLLWLPKEHGLKYGRNVYLSKENQLKLQTSGLFIPPFLLRKSKKWYNAHQRLNSFSIGINFTTHDPKNIHFTRLNTFKHYNQQNADKYPHFGALHSSLSDHFI